MVVTDTAAAAPAAVRLLMAAKPAAVKVFSCILTRQPIGRTEVARMTGLSQSAVTKAVSPLIAVGLVEEQVDHQREATPGRPVNPLRVNVDALLAIGVKVNHTDLFAVVTDFAAHIVTVLHQSIADTEFTTVVDGIVDIVERIQDQLGDDRAKIVGIGVAVSGDVDSTTGTVRESGLLHWTNEPLRDVLATRLTAPVLVENDVRALIIAEHWFGVGVGTDSFAIVTIGRGIGCGLHINREVVEGAFGVAGEIGHLPLASPDRICACGRRGCVEAVASDASITAAVSAATGIQGLTIDDAFGLASTGDTRALAVFHAAGEVLGRAIATMVNLAGPELVLISGEAAAHYDIYASSLNEAFSAHAFGAAANCPIMVRQNSFDDWARGAAACVIRATVTPQIG
jgi:predicted NBD/HSP70 family sugar kinase